MVKTKSPHPVLLFIFFVSVFILSCAAAARPPVPGEQRPFTKVIRHPEMTPEETTAWEERMAVAGRYTGLSHAISLGFALVLLAGPLSFQVFGLGRVFYGLLSERPAAAWVISVATAFWTYLLVLPLLAIRVYTATVYGVLNRGFWPVFGAEVLKGFIIALCAGAALGFIFLFFRRFLRLWWALAAAIAVLFVLSVGAMYPRRLPLVGVSAELMPEERSVELVRNLTEPGGGKTLRLYVDRSSPRSDLIWAGSSLFTREVVVSKGALENLTHYELEVLVAHELAYYETAYRAENFLLAAVLLVSVFFLTDLFVGRFARYFGVEPPPDPRAVPITAAVLLSLLFLAVPIMNGFSRYIEKAADDYAVRATRKPVTAAELYRKEAVVNLSAPEPNAVLHLLLDSREPPTDRIALARGLRQELAR